MCLLLRVTAAAMCIIISECKERTASLVVLPPLVIGYDELYHDSQQEYDNKHTEPKLNENEQSKQVKKTLRESAESATVLQEIAENYRAMQETTGNDTFDMQEAVGNDTDVMQEPAGNNTAVKQEFERNQKAVMQETAGNHIITMQEIVGNDTADIENRRRRLQIGQRDILIDVKGRRRHLRKFMRGRERNKS